MNDIKNKRYCNKKRIFILISVFALFLFLTIFILPIYTYVLNILANNSIILANDDMRVHFIDVGQGDAILIELSDGKIMLIDTGTAYYSATLIDYINTKVLFDNSSKTIDYLVLTHSDADHIGSASAVLDEYEILNIFRPNIFCDGDPEFTLDGYYHNTATYQRTIASIYAETNANIYFSSCDIDLSTENYILNFLSPTESYYSDTNDYSPIIYLNNFKMSFLFTGDATTEIEYDLIELGIDLDIDVLKIGHHGSSTSTSVEFLESTTPTYIVISVGENTYGHPSDEVLTNIYFSNVDAKNIYMTLTQGNILFVSGENYEKLIITNDYQIVYNFNIYYLLLFFIVCDIILIIKLFFIIKKSYKIKGA